MVLDERGARRLVAAIFIAAVDDALDPASEAGSEAVEFLEAQWPALLARVPLVDPWGLRRHCLGRSDRRVGRTGRSVLKTDIGLG